MASGVRVKLNMAGVREALNDDGVIKECMRRASDIATAADANVAAHEDPRHPNTYDLPPHACFEGRTSRGNRCATVVARTDEAKAMQARHSTLTRAIDAGRG